MATGCPAGIIIRTSDEFSGRYAYVPIESSFPRFAMDDELDAMFANSLAAAPHFPNITILDSSSSNILYQNDDSFTDMFHVYNLVNRSHFSISFPYAFAVVTAAIVIDECIHFKVLVVCIKEHPNIVLAKAAGDKPLAFYVYSSKQQSWSRIPNPYSSALTSGKLLPYRRKPIHGGEDAICIDLTDRFLIHFAYMKEEVNPIKKLVSFWDEATRYDESRGNLHCVKFNPIDMRVEVYEWKMETPNYLWRLVAARKVENLRMKLLGLHPDDENLVFMRSEDKDEILMVDIKRNLQTVIIGGTLRDWDCDILHPRADGSEGEVFPVSLFGTQLILLLTNGEDIK